MSGGGSAQADETGHTLFTRRAEDVLKIAELEMKLFSAEQKLEDVQRIQTVGTEERREWMVRNTMLHRLIRNKEQYLEKTVSEKIYVIQKEINAGLPEEVKFLRAQNEELKRDNKAFMSVNQQLLKNEKALRKELVELEETLRHDNTSMTEQLAHIRLEYHRQNTTIQVLEQKNAELRMALDRTTEENRVHSQLLRDAQQRITGLENEEKRHTEIFRKVLDEIRATRAAYQTLKQEKDSVVLELETLRNARSDAVAASFIKPEPSGA